MTYIICEPCIGVKDASCVEACPVDCIHTTDEDQMYFIDPDVCIECEQCEIVCPVDAIFLDFKLPAQYEPSIEVNATFFRQNKTEVGPVPLVQAWEMVSAAQAYAAEKGLAVAVAVVDEAGAPIALSRMNGAHPRTAELAFNKAYTAATFQVATQELVAQANRPWIKSLTIAHRGRVLPAAGGIAIADGIVVRGAIGVAGAPNDGQDVLCSRAGLAILEPAH